jgi:hypothetical protein
VAYHYLGTIESWVRFPAGAPNYRKSCVKKRFLLQLSNPEGDCNFLNATPIYFTFVGDAKNDSGWCDWETGARIISQRDKIILVTEDSEEEATIKLTFGERLQELEDEIRPEELVDPVE